MYESCKGHLSHVSYALVWCPFGSLSKVAEGIFGNLDDVGVWPKVAGGILFNFRVVFFLVFFLTLWAQPGDRGAF